MVQPLDPLLFGTGKPFSNVPGSQADSWILPPPSTLAGMVRARVGSGGPFDEAHVASLKAIEVVGPLLAVLTPTPELVFPAPADVVRARVDEERHELRRLVPLLLRDTDGVGAAGGLAPVGATPTVRDKPAKRAPAYWREAALMAWLEQPEDKVVSSDWGLRPPRVEVRTHVRMGPDGTAEDGGLFSTAGRRFIGALDGAMVPLGVYGETGAGEADGFCVLGGEGRLSRVETRKAMLPSEPPEAVIQSARAGAVRMYLATPAALGSNRWQPPGGVRVVAQVHGRAVVVSGWEMRPKADEEPLEGYAAARRRWRRGRPKASRRLVPAGAVFFLRLDAPDEVAREALVRRLWRRSICSGQDAKDGFGLALFGTWDGALAPLELDDGGR